MVTQVSPFVLLGLLTERPPPAGVAAGTIFHATDSFSTFVLVIDEPSNHHHWDPIISSTAFAHEMFVFNGGLNGSPGMASGFQANSGTPSAQVVAFMYPNQFAGVGLINNLRVWVYGNDLATATDITVYVNGIPTGVTVNVPAGFTGAVPVPAATALFAPSDHVDLFAINVAGGTGKAIGFTASFRVI